MRLAKQILVVDPDDASRAQIVSKLETNQIRALEATDGRQALEVAHDARPDLVVTELVLGDITGLNLCRRLREDPALDPMPVVVLSRYADEVDRILCFELGVDDFVPKPFSANELVARLKAILRRPPARANTTAAPGAHGAAPPRPGEVRIGDLVVEATPRELQILAELVRQEGRVVSREEILERVWEPGTTATPRTVDAHIKALRRKLGRARDCIRTIRGIGYRYEPIPGKPISTPA